MNVCGPAGTSISTTAVTTRRGSASAIYGQRTSAWHYLSCPLLAVIGLVIELIAGKASTRHLRAQFQMEEISHNQSKPGKSPCPCH